MDSTLFSTLLVLFVVSLTRQQVNVRPPDQQINPPNCGQQATASGRAAGGRDATDGEFPWLAGLDRVYEGGPGRCTAFIINSNWLLSAGHCCVNDTGRYREFIAHVGNVTWDSTRMGFNSLRSHRVVSQVSLYNSSLSRVEHRPNDICLLETAEPMDTSNPMITPICLPGPGTELNTNDNYTFAGFGYTQSGSREAKAQVLPNSNIVAQGQCLEMANAIRSRHGNPRFYQEDDEELLRSLSEWNFCRNSTPLQGPCIGDSGGPLMHLSHGKWTVVGVHVERIETRPLISEYPCGIVHIFVNVLPHYNWIYFTITGQWPPTSRNWLWPIIGLCIGLFLPVVVARICFWSKIKRLAKCDAEKSGETVSFSEDDTTLNVSSTSSEKTSEESTSKAGPSSSKSEEKKKNPKKEKKKGVSKQSKNKTVSSKKKKGKK